MSGHSKWSKVKHQKAVTDVKKGQVFSKLARLITLIAKKGGDPNNNPALREALEKAKAVNMPSENIERAIKKGAGGDTNEILTEVRYDAYSQNGIAMIIEGITDNTTRTSNEIKHILLKHGGKLAEQGSVLWMFTKKQGGGWNPKHLAEEINEQEKQALNQLVEELESHDDIQKVSVNLQNN